MTKAIVEYVVRFKDWSGRNPAHLSVEGGAALQQLLLDPVNCPKFVMVQDDTVNTDEISGVDSVYERPKAAPPEPTKPMTPEQRLVHEQRMAEFRSRFGIPDRSGKPHLPGRTKSEKLK